MTTTSPAMASPSDGADATKVYASLITNLNYLPGLLTLHHSLQRSRTRFPFIALHPPSLPPQALAAITARGIQTLQIELIKPPSARDFSASNDPRFDDTWTKLVVFSLVQFHRIVLLDSDMLIRSNIDDLMDIDLLPPDAHAPSLSPANSYAPSLSPSTSPSSSSSSSSQLSRPPAAAGTSHLHLSPPPLSSASDPLSSSSSSSSDPNASSVPPYYPFPDPTTSTDAPPDPDPNTDTDTDPRYVLAAGHACVCNPLKKPHYPPEWIPPNCPFTSLHPSPLLAQSTSPHPPPAPAFNAGLNSGLLVLRPSANLYAQITAYMLLHAPEFTFPDQDLLSRLFRDRWMPLPYVYNALKTLRRDGVHAPIWRDDCVKNVHYILHPKPWDELDDKGSWTGTDELHRWWVDANEERRRDERARGIMDGV